MDRVIFTASLAHETRGVVNLTISIPVKTCYEHAPGWEADEDTPIAPHVYSTSGYHTDYALCVVVTP